MRKFFIIQLLILSLFSAGFSNESVCTKTYKDIVPIVQELGFVVTSTTKGKHNTGSKHPLGKAVDIRTRDKTPEQVESFMAYLKGQGYVVLDERVRPKGKVWSGPHVHVHILPCGETKNKPVFYEIPPENMCFVDDYSLLQF